jgi:predicted class III extradiol MEMO1 family dioxygenase
MMGLRRTIICLGLLAGFTACNATTPEEYAQIVDDARACSDGDSCVLAGTSDCVCPTPVNASQADRVNTAAGDVDCNGAIAECIAHTNVRCEAGRCKSDESP